MSEQQNQNSAAGGQSELSGLVMFHPDLRGCSDGGCIIKPPSGMHTNGGCGCMRELMRSDAGRNAVRTINFLRSQIKKMAKHNDLKSGEPQK